MCDLRDARVFAREKMENVISHDRGEKFTAWPKAHLDKAATMHVDHQRINQDFYYQEFGGQI